jgi:hypothetical protein
MHIILHINSETSQSGKDRCLYYLLITPFHPTSLSGRTVYQDQSFSTIWIGQLKKEHKNTYFNIYVLIKENVAIEQEFPI